MGAVNKSNISRINIDASMKQICIHRDTNCTHIPLKFTIKSNHSALPLHILQISFILSISSNSIDLYSFSIE